MKGIITFHSIDSSGSVVSYDPRAFADLALTLAESPLPVCDLDTLLDSRTRRGIALTFDDGMASVFTHALPILKEHAMCAHLFLTTTSVGRDNQWCGQSPAAPVLKMLQWDQIEACHAGGMLIESHTATHPDLRRLSDDEIGIECNEADEAIERRLGRRPSYFAYPYGYSDSRVRRLVAQRYRGCVTTRLGALRNVNDRAALPRIDAYYLKTPWTYHQLETLPVRLYLALRSLLRTLRGTQ